MRLALPLATLTILLTGCIPLRQASRVSGPEHPQVLLCDDRFLLVAIDMRRENLVPEQSYIESPRGQRYRIQVEPHQFDIDQQFEAVSAEVYPCDTAGTRLKHWSNGTWSFRFVVETNGVAQTIDQQWKYSSFYYNRIVNVAPD
jgi:hypothetical protein